MWTCKLFLVLEFLFYMVTVSDAWGLCTCKLCWQCTGCSATSCKGRNRALSLLDYLDRYDQEVNRQLQVSSPVIPCSIPNKMCASPYNKYCCALQSDGSSTCGLGEGWSTCVAGSALINNIITPIYTKSQCDFDFPCTGNGGNDCCGGLDLYNGEGAGTCSTTYCTSSDLQIVACNYVGTSALVYKTPAFDDTILVNGVIPTQSNNEYCGNGNRGNGRCRASNLCCSPLGLCSKVDSCTTKSISWLWYGGSTNQFLQLGGAADSSIPCGNGVIGHGRCPTDASTYGITCCSDTGLCSSSYCNGASGNAYTCSCAHGTAGRGTRGCKTCASCNDGYYLSSSNGNTCSPVKLDSFNCPLGSFVISINLWYDSGSKFITGIDSFTCSTSSSTVNVNKGQKTGAQRSSTESSGYCGGKVGYVYRPLATKNQFTTELTVSSCDSVSSTTYGGPISSESTNVAIAYGFQLGRQLTGMQAATCQNAGSNNVCFLTFTFTTVPTPSPTPSTVAAPTATTKVSCNPGNFITKINLSAGSYVNGITSITCSDNTVMQVSTVSTGTSKTVTSGDGTSSSLGYCSFRSGLSSSFVTQLKFYECNNVIDGTFGTTSATTTTVKCPTGMKAVGISITGGGGFLNSFAFVCGTITTNVSCASNAYVTQITLWSSSVVYGISSITCSDNSSKVVNTGLVGGTPSTANSSEGYCTYSTGLSGSFITQFTLGHCGSSATDGPFGTNTASVTPHGCDIGQMASGVNVSGGTALTSFSFACATIATGAPTPAPTQTPTTIQPTYAPSAAPTPIPTQTPTTGKPTAAPSAPFTFSCKTGSFITQIRIYAVNWLIGIIGFDCSDGQPVQFNAGGAYGVVYPAASSTGYCTASSGLSSGNVSQLKLIKCEGGGTDGPYGSNVPGTIVSTACNPGERIVGMTAFGPSGSSGAITTFVVICGVITYVPPAVCSQGSYMNAGVCTACVVDKTAPRGSTDISACVASTDGIIGCFKDFCDNGGSRDLSVNKGDSSSNTYASCAAKCSGYKYFGVEYATSCFCGNSYGTHGVPTPQVYSACNFDCSGDSTQKCGGSCLLTIGLVNPVVPPGNCSCVNGVGCVTCDSCNSGYALNPSTYLCDPTRAVKCSTGKFITRFSFKYYGVTNFDDWVDGVKSFTCSDGVTKTVNAGGTSAGGTLFQAYAGDGSSNSPGYCAISNKYDSKGVVLLSLTECSGGVDGPVGSYQPTTPIYVQKSCGNGERAVGIETTSTTRLLYFNLICGTITSAPTAAPTPIPTQAPTTGKPTAAPTAPFTFSCQTGSFITQIRIRSGSSLDGIMGFDCSDGQPVQIDAGGTGGQVFRATSLNGYCAASRGSLSGYISFLKLTECETGVIDGPFGAYNSGMITPTPCDSGQRVVGLTATGDGGGIMVFDVICGVITSVPPAVCSQGSYLNAGVCTACPLDQTSPLGSTDISACVASTDGIIGCFNDYCDGGGSRDLSVNKGDSFSNTYASCKSQCSGYKYFGVEYATSCFCGNSYGTHGVPTPLYYSACNMDCSGDNTHKCGGSCTLTIGLV